VNTHHKKCLRVTTNETRCSDLNVMLEPQNRALQFNRSYFKTYLCTKFYRSGFLLVYEIFERFECRNMKIHDLKLVIAYTLLMKKSSKK